MSRSGHSEYSNPSTQNSRASSPELTILSPSQVPTPRDDFKQDPYNILRAQINILFQQVDDTRLSEI